MRVLCLFDSFANQASEIGNWQTKDLGNAKIKRVEMNCVCVCVCMSVRPCPCVCWLDRFSLSNLNRSLCYSNIAQPNAFRLDFRLSSKVSPAHKALFPPIFCSSQFFVFFIIHTNTPTTTTRTNIPPIHLHFGNLALLVRFFLFTFVFPARLLHFFITTIVVVVIIIIFTSCTILTAIYIKRLFSSFFLSPCPLFLSPLFQHLLCVFFSFRFYRPPSLLRSGRVHRFLHSFAF